jgi:hypothetical protein
VTRETRWRPENDPEYMAEMQRAMQSVSWGCVVFIVGMMLAAITVLVLGSFFFTFRPLK